MNTKVWQTLSVAAIASIAVAGSVQAANFTIFGTGNNGTAVTNGIPDTHFTLVTSVAGTAFTAGQTGGALVSTTGYNSFVPPNSGPANTGASWITPAGTDASGTTDYYIYQETFDIPVGATALDLIGDVTGDDYVEDVILNGTIIAPFTRGADAYTVPNVLANGEFNYSGGALTTGINTIDFIVPNVSGQSALYADLSGTYNAAGVVPEPSTVAVYMIGSLALLGFVVRKKRIS